MKRVAVLRGGPSEEYAVSMQTGQAVLRALDELKHPYKDVVITKQGDWLQSGYVRSPKQILDTVDIVFIAMHGTYGEDGQIQRILERLGIPYIGTRSLASGIAFNKELTKQTLKPHGLKMPRHRRYSRTELDRLSEEIPHIFEEIGTELFVKPLANGSSLGAQYIPHEAALTIALTELLKTYEHVLIEEFIRGKEATVGVLDHFRNEPSYVLPVIEIIPPHGNPFFTHENKYNGTTEEICPGRFSYQEKSLLAEAALLAHQVIDCKDYSRSDFIVRNGEVYFLEVNTLPGLTTESLYPKAAAAVGLEFPELISHLVNQVHL